MAGQKHGHKLTPKQSRFVDEYLVDLNATQAAIRAGYSERTAQMIGSENLSKPIISEKIALAQAERSKRTQVTSDRVVTELAKIGFSDLRRVFTAQGHIIDPADWDDDTAGAISSLEVVHTHKPNKDNDGPIEHTYKIKAWDKNSALEKLGKHLGMYVDKSEVKHDLTDPFKEVMAHIANRGGRVGGRGD